MMTKLIAQEIELVVRTRIGFTALTRGEEEEEAEVLSLI